MRTLSGLYLDEAKARAWWARQHWHYFWHLGGRERWRDLRLMVNGYAHSILNLWWALVEEG